jgi:hypothetical protein
MQTSCGSGRLLAVPRNLVKRKDAYERVAYCIALNTKPLAAAEGMAPALKRVTPSVLAGEKIVCPLLIRELLRLGRAHALVRAAERKLVFVSGAAAVWARNA